MKKILSIVYITLALCFTLALQTSQAQHQKDSTQKKSPLQKVMTKGGSVLYGRIVRSRKDFIIIETKDDMRITLPTKSILRIETVVNDPSPSKKDKKPLTREEWYRRGMYTNKYFISTTGFNLKKNEAYIESTQIFLLSARWGITNNFSIGAGGIITGEGLFFVNPKLTIPINKRFRLGASFNWLSIPNVGGLGLLNLVATYGSEDYNFSGGLSYGVFNGKFTPRPFVNLGTMLRPANRVALMGEVILLPIDTSFGTVNNAQQFMPLASFGLRFINQKSSIDLGLLYINSEGVNGSRLAVALPLFAYRHKL